MLIGLGEDKAPIGFGFTTSKDNVIRATFVNKCETVFCALS